VEKKDFAGWHQKKSEINALGQLPFFHEREIWFCYLGANVGSEQDGRGADFLRPVMILRKFNNQIFWGVPLTKAKNKIKTKTDKYYYPFSFVPGITSVAILSQVRLIDARRLGYKLGEIGERDFASLIKKFKALLP